MSKQRDVQRHIDTLHEIHSIMSSINNLAMQEMRKLGRYHSSQQRVVTAIDTALNDVRWHYAPATEMVADAQPAYLLLGSERGFCGSYNEQLTAMLAQQPDQQQAAVIGVGTHLQAPLQRDNPRAVCLPGAAVADEVAAILTGVAGAVTQLRQQHGALRLEVIHFQPETLEPNCLPLIPAPVAPANQGLAPLINLPPRQLLAELLEQYLFALINAWYFAALISENQHRIQHLDRAAHHLETRIDELGRRRNRLRQEEITEEIEEIILNAGARAPGIKPAPGFGRR